MSLEELRKETDIIAADIEEFKLMLADSIITIEHLNVARTHISETSGDISHLFAEFIHEHKTEIDELLELEELLSWQENK